MAIDLLRDPHCDHYLRYDFESTLWLGFYWCLQYDDDGKKIRDRNFIAEWSSGGFEEVSDKKRGKLYAELYFTRKHNSLRAGIEKLFRVFRQIYNEEREIYCSIESQAGLEKELTADDRNRTKTLRRLELCHWTGCDKVEKAIEI
ncbi:hypothetical protein FRC02_010602 [Tulasnella sp. 418]|nr:hypothetical protein FRC02_010602 [Tulasnella sp. 418]